MSMDVRSLEAVVRRMIQLYSDGTPEEYGSDRFLELFADDAVIYLPPAPGFAAQRGGKEAFRAASAKGSALFRNRKTRIHEIVVQGERVVARNTWTATLVVDAIGMQAGTVVRFDYVDFCTVRDGLIVEYTNVGSAMVPAQ
ncbi:MAG: nuclear transport factor 2 family protein [Dehalococcoidia bacterium]|nr:nuclear transport factor 2 family protein [Dehalococcoidia bacterium]MCB9487046.1 nuclear transport factor 2 family protein [Thermoflexaceae bacterium]